MSYSPNEVVNGKLRQAAILIRAKRYAEARTILKPLNDPIARKWLKRVDEVDQPKKNYLSQRIKPYLLLFALLGCSIVAFSFVILSDPRAGGYNPFQVRTPEAVASRLLQITPEVVIINDRLNTNIPETFLEQSSEAITSNGYVSYFEGSINQDERFQLDLEVYLDNSANRREIALSTIATLLRLYATQVPLERQGYIKVQVGWIRSSYECRTGAGVGFHVIQEIDWTTAGQDRILQTIDRETYSRNTDGTTTFYGEIAWAPSNSGISECNL